MMLNKKVTIIIPIRLSVHLFKGLQRLEFIIKNVPDKHFDILIIDYGSDYKYRNILKSLVNKKYIKIYTVVLPIDSPFSIGKARDIGSQHAKTPIIFFHDVDFICTYEMYFNIYREIMARDMLENNVPNFFCVPVAFLNSYGTNDFLDNFEVPFINNIHHQNLLTQSSKICDFIAYGSSAIVVNRYHYLRLGGHHKKFSGHGAEDYDILHKLAKYHPKRDRPSNYYKDTKSNLISNYSGFRVFFSLYGIDVFYKGISMVHLWHPPRSLPNYFKTKKNFSILKKVMKDYDKEKFLPLPLADKTLDRKTLVLSHEKSIFVKSIRDVIPAMGLTVFVDENFFNNVEDLELYCNTEKIDIIGFKNPYGNSHRLKLYQAVKKKNISFWVMDRGALPDSWFFDKSGFNYDSETYSRSKWNRELKKDESEKVDKYIDEVCKSDKSLEKSESKIGAKKLKKKLNIKDRKILFIPFQRPSDSVCKYFSGNMNSAKGFNYFVECLIKIIDDNDWLILGKKHPLEKKKPNIKNMIFVPDNTHINDLIDISDKILLLNSGVGLLALLFNKPVIYTGKAFYGHKGLNYYAESVEEAKKLINSTLLVDNNLSKKFIYYLTSNIYSFGKTNYVKIKRKDKSLQMLAKNIDFEEIRGISKVPIFLRKKNSYIDFNEPMFNSFRKKETTNKKFMFFFNMNYSIRKKISLFVFFSFSILLLRKNKIEKLKRNPESFFRDSNSSIVKSMGKVIGF